MCLKRVCFCQEKYIYKHERLKDDELIPSIHYSAFLMDKGKLLSSSKDSLIIFRELSEIHMSKLIYVKKVFFLDTITASLLLYCESSYIFQIGIGLNFHKCFPTKYKNIKL